MEKCMPTNGEIGDMTIPLLFHGLLEEKISGTVVFTRDPVAKKVFVETGDVVFASSSLSEDRLGEWLQRKGTITRQQCDIAAEGVKRTGMKQGEVLVELGFITPEALEDGMRYQVRQIVISLFNWRNGSYLFDDALAPPVDVDRRTLPTGDLIIEGLREMEWSVVRKSLPPLGTVLLPSPGRTLQGDELGKEYRPVLSLIDGTASIEEVCARSGIGDFSTLKAVYALLALRLVVTRDLKKAGGKKPVQDAGTRTEEVKEKRTTEPVTAELLTRVMLLEVHEKLAKQDHYEVLGVSRSATAKEFKKAYFTLAKKYHPDRHFGPPLNEMKPELEALFHAIHTAHETLADPAKREQYDRELARGLQRQRVKKGTGSDMQDKADAAAAHFSEGMKCFFEHNFWDAEESFQWAIRFDPSNAEYVFRCAMALSYMPRRGRDTEEYFVKAIKMAPARTGYSIEFANFYLRFGQKAKAMDIYQKALKLRPNAKEIREAIIKAGE